MFRNDHKRIYSEITVQQAEKDDIHRLKESIFNISKISLPTNNVFSIQRKECLKIIT